MSTKNARREMSLVTCVYKEYHKCFWCKTSNHLTLHHVDASKKEMDIPLAIKTSWIALKTELPKCVVLCKNCHKNVEMGKIGKVKRSYKHRKVDHAKVFPEYENDLTIKEIRQMIETVIGHTPAGRLVIKNFKYVDNDDRQE